MTTLLLGASQVVTCRGPARARRGSEMASLDVVERGVVAIGDDGLIADVGREAEMRSRFPDASVEEIDGVLFPGFVDSHTHGVFGAPRLEDHERRARGISYQEIAAQGGGILSSVRSVRDTARRDLAEATARRLAWLSAHGTTTIEVKSGYGLTVADEVKQLEVIRDLSDGTGPALVPTFLGAHEVPPEYRDQPDAYVELVVREMLPAVVERGLARFCDVFCEPGVFSPDQARTVLSAARASGLRAKIHADELEGSAGAELAVELGAISADHLAAISEAGVDALASSETVAVLLPGTMMFLGRPAQAPARRLIDAGAAVALATDFNPGSSPGMSLPLMATMGVSQLRMVPAETIIAMTVNGAAAVGEEHRRGQVAPTFRADLALAMIRDWRELPYWYGVNLVARTWVGGAACPPSLKPLHSES